MIVPSSHLDLARRADLLLRLGAAETDLDALLTYTDNPFDLSGPLVLEDEPFVSVWAEYLAEAESEGVFDVLRRVLPQLRFPIREGMSDDPAYRAATRQGDTEAFGTNSPSLGELHLAAPERLRLELHLTPAGRIPVLTAPLREDFVVLVQALSRRNEPVPVPRSMGALMVSGYNNWDRVSRYRRAWESGGKGSWGEAFRALVPQQELYQDRFILLSEGPYGAVPARQFGLTDEEWICVSHQIRREHESAHYYCRRALGAMRSNALDEWIADAAGLLAAGVPDPASWARAFLTAPETGRVGTYCGGLTPHQVEIIRSLLDDVILWAPWTELQRASHGPAALAVVVRCLAGDTLEGQWAAGERHAKLHASPRD